MSEERRFYVDTSVIVARYKPSDRLHADSERLFRRESFKFYVSSLTLVELYSVFSRMNQLEHPLVGDDALSTLVAFTIRDCRLRVVRRSRPVETSSLGERVNLPMEYYFSMKFAHELKLRTLDLIHLAHAWVARSRDSVEAFVTGDEEVLEKSEVIRKIFKVRAVHPSRAV